MWAYLAIRNLKFLKIYIKRPQFLCLFRLCVEFALAVSTRFSGIQSLIGVEANSGKRRSEIDYPRVLRVFG